MISCNLIHSTRAKKLRKTEEKAEKRNGKF